MTVDQLHTAPMPPPVLELADVFDAGAPCSKRLVGVVGEDGNVSSGENLNRERTIYDFCIGDGEWNVAWAVQQLMAVCRGNRIGHSTNVGSVPADLKAVLIATVLIAVAVERPVVDVGHPPSGADAVEAIITVVPGTVIDEPDVVRVGAWNDSPRLECAFT